MNLHSLATLLLRLFGITHGIKTVTGIFTTTAYLQQTLWHSEASNIGNLVIISTLCAVILANVILCALIIYFAPSIARRLVPEDSNDNAQSQNSPAIWLQIGLLLIGTYLLVTNFAPFVMNTIGWLQEQVASIESLPSKHNAPMARSTTMMLVAAALILRGKSLSNLLVKISK